MDTAVGGGNKEREMEIRRQVSVQAEHKFDLWVPKKHVEQENREGERELEVHRMQGGGKDGDNPALQA